MLALTVAVSAAACDAKRTQDDQTHFGPSVTILGTSISAANSVVASDGVIQIAFDRYLLPATATRQSYAIVDNLNAQLPPDAIRTIYDPIARTITIAGPDGPGVVWLTEGNVYKLVLTIPPDINDTSDIGGFRAIDGAPLDANQALQFPFTAGPASGITTIDPPVDFCSDVLPIFAVKCGSSSCHGTTPTGETPQAAASLILDTADSVRVTAIGRVAQGSNTGARSFTPATPGNLFGVDMAIIQPNDPGSSWLMYKFELAPPVVGDAGPVPPKSCPPLTGAPANPAPAAPYASLAPIRAVADDAERAVLSNFILGQVMPYPATPQQYENEPLTFLEREIMRVWIATGANVRTCGGCSETAPTTDAGTH